MRLLKSELRKVLYVRSNWGLLIAAVFISALSTAVTVPLLDADSTGALGVSLETTMGVDAVYANAVSGYIFAIILGVLMMTGEFRHGTAVATFLTSPKRSRVVLAKIAVAALAAAVLMIISALAGFLAGWLALQTVDNAAEPSDNIFINMMLASVLAGVVLGIIGLAIGTLIKNQLLAIVATLVYLFVVDPLLLALAPEAGKYLPTGLITAMLNVSIDAPQLGFDTSQYLPPLQAAGLLVAIGAVFASVSIFTSLRR
ncbi:MAG: ABC transporter permease, partial [Microbacteriaceae bacterium]|nr:ABC transporter permease [Microbacteriaceae bacterium]